MKTVYFQNWIITWLTYMDRTEMGWDSTNCTVICRLNVVWQIYTQCPRVLIVITCRHEYNKI